MIDRKRTDELTVITKTYDLILWSSNHTGKFPRNHRFVLGERIERNLYDLLETLIQAKYTKQRQPLLEKANLMLEILRFQMRLAKDLQCLKVESYGFARTTLIHSISSLNGPAFLSPRRKPRPLTSCGATGPASLTTRPNEVATNLSSGNFTSIHSSFLVCTVAL